MKRREFIETAALTALAGVGSGCAVQETQASAPPPPLAPQVEHEAVNLAVSDLL